MVETIYPDGATNGTLYDGVGRVAQMIDARGTTNAYAYDAAGRRLAVTNAFGTSVAATNFYAYDPDGNQLTFGSERCSGNRRIDNVHRRPPCGG